MSNPLEDFNIPRLSGDCHSSNFDPLRLLGEARFQAPGVSARVELPSIDFDNIFDKLHIANPGHLHIPLPHNGELDVLFSNHGDSAMRMASQHGLPFSESVPSTRDLPFFRSPQDLPFFHDLPSPGDAFHLPFGDKTFSSSSMLNPLTGDGILSGNFGDSFGRISNLLSHPDTLISQGLFGGNEGIGGIIGHLTDPVKDWVGNITGIGDIGGKLGGILGSVSNFLGPIGGVVGGIMGGEKGGVKGLLSSVASGFSFGGPIGAGIMGIANLTGLNKLAGKALGGIVDGAKNVVKSIGGGIVSGIKHLFGG